jgi:hypothetical protein
MLASGGMKIGASLLGRKATKEADALNEELSLTNQALIKNAGEFEEMLLRRNKQKALGDIRASFGASGVTLEGSPLDVLADSTAMATLDILNSKFNTEMKLRAERINRQLDASRAEDSGVVAALDIGSTISSTIGDLI